MLLGISTWLIQSYVKPNDWHGFQTKRTPSDPAIWYKLNTHTGQRALISKFMTIFVDIVLHFVPSLNANV